MSDLATLQARLTKIDAAIDAAITGAEYEIRSGSSSRRLRRQDLKTLQAERASLELSIARLTGEGVRGVRHGVPS